MTIEVMRLGSDDLTLCRDLMTLFGGAFAEPETYTGARPPDAYHADLLSRPGIIVLVAHTGADLVGGLVAYELPKLEQRRSEIYIYDLAVVASHRRRGIATALIREAVAIAGKMGAWVVYVQADRGDAPATALYDSLGNREEVLHFDIAVKPTKIP